MEMKNSKQLYNKLFLIYTAILLCVVSALVLYFYSSTKNRILEQNLNYTELMSRSAFSYLEETAEAAEHIHEDLYQSNMELNDALHYMTDEPDRYRKYRLDIYIENKSREYKGIEKFFMDAFQVSASLEHITLYSYERDELTLYTRDGRTYRKQADQDFKQRLQKEEFVEEGGISYLKEIRDLSAMQVKGCMLLTFQNRKLKTIQQYYSHAELFVYHETGTKVFASSNDYTAADIIQAEKSGTLENVLKAYAEHVQVKGYHVISYLEKKRASAVPVSSVVMIFGVGILALMLGEMFVRYYLQRLSVRLNRILDGMTQVMEGELNMRIPADKNGDELDLISKYFNEMCERLDAHIQKQYLAEIEQKNAEMAALQSQINPHFLYNTLEAVRMKAICNGDREVGRMLYSLAVTFRAQIKEADIITLAQELHYSKKYMELFEYRYQDQFQVYVECPEKYMQVPIIKFVLQPIIENYFIHGIRMRETDNYIRIAVEKEESYRIVIEDNGRGMTKEELEAKNRELESDTMKKHDSIGIANVNRRLKAVYGKRYGIHLEAGEEGGLRVILRFLPDGRQGEEDDEKSDVSGK